MNLKEIKSVVISGADKAKGTIASGLGVAGDAVTSGAGVVGDAVSSGANTVASGLGVAGDAIVSGAGVAGDAVSSGANTVASGLGVAGDAVASGAGVVGDAVASGSSTAYDSVKSSVVDISSKVSDIDWSNVKDSDFRNAQFQKYKDLTTEKILKQFNSTFEVDKDSVEIVESVKKSLPIPVKTADDIFEQCKNEAIRRATASFFLSGMLQNIDDQSTAKYENLSESYRGFSGKVGGGLVDDPNYSHMKNVRHDARSSFEKLENGYNESDPLYPHDVDIEHVIAKKEYYNDILLRAGTTDDELITAINSEENLVFADSALNRSLQDKNIYEYLEDRGVPHPDSPDLIDVEINGRIITVNKLDINKAVNKAEDNRKSHKVDAVKEIGETAIKTGATLAVQQVIGLIVVETIDIFIDELKIFIHNFNLFSKEGLIDNTKETSERIKLKLEQRLEEKQIWEKAKELGIESGVAGALSVIPQIIISTILKMPSFVLALVRESTLSVVRSVRVLSSKDPNKLESIGIIMAGTASAVVGLYLSRVISSGVAGVPILNKFNSQITNVLSGLLITAIPLSAIYIFDQNKSKFMFKEK